MALLSLGWGCCAVVRWALIVSPSYVAWVDLELWLRKISIFLKKFNNELKLCRISYFIFKIKIVSFWSILRFDSMRI